MKASNSSLQLYNNDKISKQVVSFNGEKKAIAMYNTLIKRAYKATFMEGIITGLGIGCILFVVFCSYYLAF
uniref:ABC transmembrane type-1 domain-containing protein n=1 Tax=Arundo donax TaxID=35708 RepID=A0A0A9DZG1_ARUDO